MRFWGSSKLDEIGWCWMHIQAWIWWQGILLQSQFSLFLCILKPEAYAQKSDRSQLHIMNWHPDYIYIYISYSPWVIGFPALHFPMWPSQRPSASLARVEVILALRGAPCNQFTDWLIGWLVGCLMSWRGFNGEGPSEMNSRSVGLKAPEMTGPSFWPQWWFFCWREWWRIVYIQRNRMHLQPTATESKQSAEQNR